MSSKSPAATRFDTVWTDRCPPGARPHPTLKAYPGFQTECLKRALERSQTACTNLYFLSGLISTKGQAIWRLAPGSRRRDYRWK